MTEQTRLHQTNCRSKHSNIRNARYKFQTNTDDRGDNNVPYVLGVYRYPSCCNVGGGVHTWQ